MVRAKVKLPALISDGMVLQREQTIKVWHTFCSKIERCISADNLCKRMCRYVAEFICFCLKSCRNTCQITSLINLSLIHI